MRQKLRYADRVNLVVQMEHFVSHPILGTRVRRGGHLAKPCIYGLYVILAIRELFKIAWDSGTMAGEVRLSCVLSTISVVPGTGSTGTVDRVVLGQGWA